jgi:ribonuclease P protein component
MLGRAHRFHGYNSLRSVYRHGLTARTPMVNLRYASRDPKRPYRVAVVVSRKVSRSAVARNRIRRRIYAVVREAGTQVAPGTDLVFTVWNDQLAGLEASKLQAIITGLLQKAARPPAEGR